MLSDEPIIITIGDEDNTKTTSVVDEIKSLKPIVVEPKTDDDDSPVMVTSFKKNKKTKKKEKEKKKKKKSSIESTLIDDSDLLLTPTEAEDLENIDVLLDVDAIMMRREGDYDESDEIVDSGKKGYKKLKNNSNNYKKEFAEEITLLYSLLDETTQYSKELEKDLKNMRTSKVRGVSKYSNDLASLVLNAKQTKLNILKEISSVKKNIADLALKDSKENSKNANNSSSEALASKYFKNILSYGRSKYIDRLNDDSDDERPSMIDMAESEDSDMDEYNRAIEERLSVNGNPFRSSEGDKYISYEDRGVEIRVRKCLDTGEWEFIAIDNCNNVVDDYPLPDRRTAGRMKFSDDGGYVTDQMGRIYKVIEYYLPEMESD